jgi:hypothetical protein
LTTRNTRAPELFATYEDAVAALGSSPKSLEKLKVLWERMETLPTLSQSQAREFLNSAGLKHDTRVFGIVKRSLLAGATRRPVAAAGYSKRVEDATKSLMEALRSCERVDDYRVVVEPGGATIDYYRRTKTVLRSSGCGS